MMLIKYILLMMIASVMGQAVAASANIWTSTSAKEVIAELSGKRPQRSEQVMLSVPTFAEDSRSVAVRIESTIANTDSICLVAKDNVFPLMACFDFSKEAYPIVQIRIRLAKTTSLIAFVRAKGQVYFGSKAIQIGQSGCAVDTTKNTPKPLSKPEYRIKQTGIWTELYLKINHLMPRPDSPAQYMQKNFVREVIVRTQQRTLIRATFGPGVSDQPFLMLRYKASANATEVIWVNQKKQVASISLNEKK